MKLSDVKELFSRTQLLMEELGYKCGLTNTYSMGTSLSFVGSQASIHTLCDRKQ